MDCSLPGFPVHHQFLELTQTHVHWVGGVIQPSHPLSSTSHPAFNLSQHRGLFQWVSSSHQVAKVWSFIPSTHIVLFFSTFSQILSSSYWITQAWKYAFTQAYSHYPLYSSIVLLSPPPSFIHTHRGRRIFATKRKIKITRNRLQGVNIEFSKFTNTTEQWFMPKN